MLFNSQEVFAALGGQCLIAGILANQRVLKLVLFVGLLQAAGECIDLLGLIELLLGIETLVDGLHQGSCGLGSLVAQSLLRL